MIPQFLQPLKAIDVPPPPGFEPAVAVEWAKHATNVQSLPTRGQTFSQRAGNRFEAQVQSALEKDFGPHYHNNPWFAFKDASGGRRCRPDGLILCAPKLELPLALILEIKIRHMPDAWWQLRRLYGPVVQVAYPRQTVRLVEIVKEYDCAMPFPEQPRFIDSLDEALKEEPFEEIGVLIWKK